MTSQRKALSLIGGALGICLTATTSPAATIYTYTYTGHTYTDIIQTGTGPNVFDGTMSVTGSFSLANPLPANSTPSLAFMDITADVLDFSFFNGHDTLTPANTDFSHSGILVRTFGGQITDWDIFFRTASSVGASFAGALTWNAPNFGVAVAPFDEGAFFSNVLCF